MKLPTLSRKQRTVRNLAATALLLFLAAWVLDFPVLTEAALQRRAERRFFLDETEILYEEPLCMYLGDGEHVFRIGYALTPLGLRYVSGTRFDGYCMTTGKDGETWELVAVGYLADVERAALAAYFSERDAPPEASHAEGERLSPYAIRFSFPEKMNGRDWIRRGEISLYGADGAPWFGGEASQDLDGHW